MKASSLHSLHTHPHIGEWLQSDPIAINYFDGRPLRITFDAPGADPRLPSLRSAAEQFLALSAADRLRAAVYVYREYRRFADIVSDEEIGFVIASSTVVWNFVTPSELFVSTRGDDQLPYVQICAECKWEPEHGLQLVYRHGSALCRVSANDGHLTWSDAKGRPIPEDVIVYEG